MAFGETEMLCESNRLVHPNSRMAMIERRQRRSIFTRTPWQLQNQSMNRLQTQRQSMYVCWARGSTFVISIALNRELQQQSETTRKRGRNTLLAFCALRRESIDEVIACKVSWSRICNK